MKNMIRSLACSGVMLCAANVMLAESIATTTTTTTSEGTVSRISRDGLVVKTTTSQDPIIYSKTTTYVDENGNPVSVETIKTGVPVTVYYDRDGNRMVATKVIVKKTTTTTTTP